MQTSTLIVCSFVVCLLLGEFPFTSSEQVKKQSLNVLGLAGLTKSHSFAVYPVLEELAQRGHNVTFLLPNREDIKKWFPEEKRKLVHFVFDGENNWEQMRPDFKMLSWIETFKFFWNMAMSAKEFLEIAAFPADTPTNAIINRQAEAGKPIDVVVPSMISLGGRKASHLAGIPVVSYLHAPVVLEIDSSNLTHNFRFPSMGAAVTQNDLKTSFRKRVWNQAVHIFLYKLFFGSFMVPAMKDIIEKRYGEKHDFEALADVLVGTWAGKHHMVLGGAPLSNPLPPGNPHLHVIGVGVSERPTKAVAGELGEWLDRAEEKGAAVLYISMGTIYEFSQESVAPLLKQLDGILRNQNVWVLWSLREKQQKLLHAQVQTLQSSHPLHLRVESFTPQPEVLNHPAVKIFLSHCGWGGMTDTMRAGVPVLAYPGMGDQIQNSVSVVQAQAGHRLKIDFSDLESLMLHMMDRYEDYAGNMRKMHEALQEYGGLDHAMNLVEAVGRGEEVLEEQRLMDARSKVDPYFVEHSQWEARLLAHILVFSVPVLIFLVGFLLLVWLPWKLLKFLLGGGEKKKQETKKRK